MSIKQLHWWVYSMKLSFETHYLVWINVVVFLFIDSLVLWIWIITHINTLMHWAKLAATKTKVIKQVKKKDNKWETEEEHNNISLSSSV